MDFALYHFKVSADSFEETLSTLRYADRAKRIVNHAIVNEDPNAKIIRELREEVDALRLQISQTQERQHASRLPAYSAIQQDKKRAPLQEADELRERLIESERIVTQMSSTWSDRLKETQRLTEERRRGFANIGVSVTDANIRSESNQTFLVNLNADPSMNELLFYYIDVRLL